MSDNEDIVICQEEEDEEEGCPSWVCGDDESSEWNSEIVYKDIISIRRQKKASLKQLTQMSDESIENGGSPTQEDTPAIVLVLPKGGWQVNQISVTHLSDGFPTLMDSKTIVSKSKQSFGPVGNWKNISSDIFAETVPTAGDNFTQVGNKSGNRGPKPARNARSPSNVAAGPRSKPGPSGPKTATSKSGPFDPKTATSKSGPFDPKTAASTLKPAKGGSPKTGSIPKSKDVSGQSEVKTDLKNTRMCSWGAKCKRDKCTFAHSLAEFSPVKCKFDTRCTHRSDCRYFHGSCETKEQFIQRTTSSD